MNPTAKNKKVARQFWRTQTVPPSDWTASASQKICDWITRKPEFKAANQVSAFAALPWEPNLFGVWRAAPQKVVYPKIDVKNDRIDFFGVNTWSELTTGHSDIMEPSTRQPAAAWQPGDIVLVPALAFDKKLNRLGSGKGYYDRYLSEIPREVLRWGVVFHSRISEPDLPIEDFDQQVDLIISERGCFPN